MGKTPLLLCLSFFFILNSFPVSSLSCPPHQKQALLHFKSTLVGLFNSSFDLLHSWNPTSDCCSWERVSCTRTGLVSILYMSYLVPPEDNNPVYSYILTPLFHIRSLQHLDVGGNSLLGEIPGVGFSNLTNLVSLLMYGNRFNGSIPSELFQLTSLEELYLGNNQLHGVLSPDVGKLCSLIYLSLENNSLSGNIPKEIGNLTELREFWMGSNHLFGGIPSSFVNLKNLEWLVLSDNLLSMQISSCVGKLPNIKALFLEANKFTGPIPSSIQNLSKLETLRIQDNMLTGEIPTWLFNITTLMTLSIGGEGNNLIWNNKAKIVPRCNLGAIIMTNCGISGKIPEWVSSQKELFFLDLSRNKLDGRFPNWLVKMKQLKIVNLSRNKLSGTIPHPLFNSENLVSLDLSQNNFIGELPENIGNAKSLMGLILFKNKFHGNLPLSLSKLVNLKYLDLHDNNINGNLHDTLPLIRTLEVMILRNNSIEGFIPSNISKLKSLRVLDLSWNNLTGSIPVEMANLQTMVEPHDAISPDDFFYEYLELVVKWKKCLQDLAIRNIHIHILLDLSHNRIYGDIPPSLGNLKALKDLDISHNRISGHIPVSFGNLENIESLDLSHNEFSGSIPQSLVKLGQLTVLDVSNNRLAGKIPSGRQMDTMNDPDYFVNNSGLCGMQIRVVCPDDISHVNEREVDGEEDKENLLFLWDGTWVGFMFGFFSSVYIMGYFLNFLYLYQIWWQQHDGELASITRDTGKSDNDASNNAGGNASNPSGGYVYNLGNDYGHEHYNNHVVYPYFHGAIYELGDENHSNPTKHCTHNLGSDPTIIKQVKNDEDLNDVNDQKNAYKPEESEDTSGLFNTKKLCLFIVVSFIYCYTTIITKRTHAN